MQRLTNDTVYRWRLAHRWAFADWENPTAAELNVNADNADPFALVINPTCALNTDGSQYDLDDPELDETLTFCQKQGNAEVMNRSATVVLQYEMAKQRWINGASTALADGYNEANLTHAWLAWRGLENVFAILSVGPDVDAPFAPGDRVSMVEIATDNVIPELGTGSNILLSQTVAKRTDILWRYEIES